MKNLSKVLFFLTLIGIVYFSSQSGLVSKSQSSYFANFLGINSKIFGFHIRKLAHLFIYFLLGFFLILSWKKISLKKFIFSFIFILIFAFCDEFYQSFIPRRISSLKDVKIDFLGGSSGILVATLLKSVYSFFKNLFKRKE